MTRRRVPLSERFWKYVDKTDTCWNWTGGSSSKYGRVRADAPERRQLLAHRVSYEMANGPIADGLVIDHRCHNTLCVNPDHLRAVTSKQNSENVAGPSKLNKSGYLGVYEYFPGRWLGKVKHHGQAHYTQPFGTPEEAAVATKALRLSLFTCNDADRRTA